MTSDFNLRLSDVERKREKKALNVIVGAVLRIDLIQPHTHHSLHSLSLKRLVDVRN